MDQPVNPLLKLIMEQTDIETSDIPKIDLYMDQVITLFENALGSSKRNLEDKLLTKTMINNYTKDKILLPAKNKKYTPEHIVQMALIYHLKQSLSIGDIKSLFQEKLHQQDVDIWNVYEEFLEWKKAQSQGIESQIETLLDTNVTELNQNEHTLLTILSLIHQANTYKRLAEKMIDQLT
ncbi:DUF1836 domain-containing protein [Paenibacillus marinisediminis]